ncbi:hypothetical protein LNJ03_11240 [Tenacibaculum dicentrarchi]|nr:hypothetical protein [Tenacibaculum dicentrarchi]
MSAALTLAKRSKKNIIEQKYIDQVLREEASNIEKAQNVIFSNRNTPAVIRNKRSFTINNGTLTHRHDIRQRFEDMRRVRFRKQKPTKAHNKVIWGHYNNMIFKLAYGLTQDVKNQIANDYKIEL